jgi:hypothetical protein
LIPGEAERMVALAVHTLEMFATGRKFI